MTIHDERPGDETLISEIQYAAFKGHPMHAPGAEPTEHLIVERLRMASALSLSLLAEINGQGVGHIAISPVALSESGRGWYILGPVGILPEHQLKGIGSALVGAALQGMREKGAKGVVLVGDPGYYSRFGFNSFPGLKHHGVPDKYVLALPFAEEPPQGAIIAHEAFGPAARE
ncbi:MAG: N-acetyltransferase [Desulfovibrio sp.]|nr:MAG: N-acetyltransferase [Desulfovibrio sp.]